MTRRNSRYTLAAALLALAGAGQTYAAPGDVPIVADYAMQPDAGDAKKLVDAGPLGIHGHLNDGVTYAAGGHDGAGHALAFSGDGDDTARVDDPKFLNQLGTPLTISLWVKPAKFAAPGASSTLLTKTGQGWIGKPFSLRLDPDGRVGFDPSDAPGGGDSDRPVPQGIWSYIAVTYQPGGKRIFYVNGRADGEADAGSALYSNEEPLILGRGPDGDRTRYSGLMDGLHFYAAALTPAQIQQDMAGTLPTRPAVAADLVPPTLAANLHLVRYDMPLGFRDYRGITREDAQRRPSPDAVDWPRMTLRVGDAHQAVFADGPEQRVVIPEKHLPQSAPLFRQSDDPLIAPGGHWLRGTKLALWGRRDVYTTDFAARSGGWDYELWTFPVNISGAGQADVQSVRLTLDGQELYAHTEPLHSLTLLLPQNEPGHPYALSVNGHAPVTFSIGLEPIQPGHPREVTRVIRLTLPGTPRITVATQAHPETFPNLKEWDADQQAMAQAGRSAIPAPFTDAHIVTSFTQHLGVDVPRSPETVYAASLTHGMSGGFKFWSEQPSGFPGGVDEYARFLAGVGFDLTFEDSRSAVMDSPQDPNSYERWMAAMAANGLRTGLNHAALNNPSQALYGYTLPDFSAPKFRDAQLTAQRFAHFSNFVGMTMGADNADYTWYWDWNGPSSEHPWGKAFEIMQRAAGLPLTAPLPPGYGPGKPHEHEATEREFVQFLDRYNQSFVHYGDFTDAVREIGPSLMLTSGSFGSAPGVGARGGYNWATMPEKEMFARLPVMQAYDWNEQASSKPMQEEGLLDRLLSEYPGKPAWALLDDFQLFFGPQPMQRAYALALTRGVQAVGTSYLANPDNVKSLHAAPDLIDSEKSLFAWIHKYGGVYARTRPTPTVGILYVSAQALSRRVVGPGASDAEQLRGSHEGKTFEALFFCHAAGWPAKIVTPDEIKRGLPPSVKVILLVGLNSFDDTWHWYDGLTPQLTAFEKSGGRILTDDESVCPVPATKTDMHVRAYVVNRDQDWTPELLARNADNIHKLQAALQDVPPPLAETHSDTVWAIPTQAGATQYLTVVNQATPDGQNASKVVQPQTGRLTWHTSRPIYDVRLGRRLTAEEAKTVDLTRDAFRFYALPPAPVTKPQLSITRGPDGFSQAIVTIRNPQAMAGIPVQITVSQGGESATVSGATGEPVRLPLAATDRRGVYTVTATELLSGLSTTRSVPVGSAAVLFAETDRDAMALARFAARKDVPLTVALTPAQAGDPEAKALAARLVRYYKSRGRQVAIHTITPNDVVVSLQPLNAVQHFPQWKTIDSDLVLLGNPSNNVLLLDQARGYLLPDTAKIASGHSVVRVTYSPFVGRRQAVNILASNTRELADGVGRVVSR